MASIQILQQWECIVTDVSPDSIHCDMHDLTNRTAPVEFAEIPLPQFTAADAAKLAEGSVFYWSIGYEADSLGTTRRFSRFRVREFPQLTVEQQQRCRDRARQLAEAFDAHREPQTGLSITKRDL